MMTLATPRVQSRLVFLLPRAVVQAGFLSAPGSMGQEQQLFRYRLGEENLTEAGEGCSQCSCLFGSLTFTLSQTNMEAPRRPLEMELSLPKWVLGASMLVWGRV